METKHEIEYEHLPSGVITKLSTNVFNNCLNSFSDSQYSTFSNLVTAGLSFPQMMSFLSTLFFILSGETSYLGIILMYVCSGIFFTVTWYLLRLYRIPGLAFTSCFTSSFFFKFFLHYIVFAIIAFVVCEDWKVLLFCVLGAILTTFIRTAYLYRWFNRVEYNDELAEYVAGFKYKI